jgi:hypothetical protein
MPLNRSGSYPTRAAPDFIALALSISARMSSIDHRRVRYLPPSRATSEGSYAGGRSCRRGSRAPERGGGSPASLRRPPFRRGKQRIDIRTVRFWRPTLDVPMGAMSGLPVIGSLRAPMHLEPRQYPGAISARGRDHGLAFRSSARVGRPPLRRTVPDRQERETALARRPVRSAAAAVRRTPDG